MKGVDDETRPAALEQPLERRPHGVVERSLDVARDDRVAFDGASRCASSQRDRVGRTGRRRAAVAAAARRARSYERGVDPRARTPRRATTSRRHSSPAGRSASSRAIPPRTPSRSTAASSSRSTGSSAGTGSWSGSRRSWSRPRTALLVLSIGAARSLRGSRLLAALVATLQPVPDLARRPRQPRDRRPARAGGARPRALRRGASRGRSLAAACCRRALRRRDPRQHAARRAAARRRRVPRSGGARGRASPRSLLVVARRVVVAPWVVRNRVQVGCFAITTDARALWKANNVEHVRDARRRASGSTTCRSPRASRRSPEDAARATARRASYVPGRRVRADAATSSTDVRRSGSIIPARRRS